MAAMTTVLKAIITADASKMKKTMAEAGKSMDAFSEKATATGKKLTRNVTAPLIAVGGLSIKAAADFEASMTKIQSLVGLSAETVQGFEQDVRRLAGTTAQAPKDLADAMFFITSAGLRGAAATETLEAAAKAAAVGLGDTATIADLATSALNAYGESNISATKATDVMVAAVREGKLEAGELAGSMGRVLPIASAMGVRFDEVGAAFAALSRTGTNAAEAATQVRGILSSLLRPSVQAEKALKGMGLSSEGLRKQIKEEGLLATLKTLSEEFAGNEAAAASVFGNIRALSGVMDLMGANVATTEQIFANMKDTTGALDQAFDATSETAAFKLSQAMANIKQALIDLGNVLIPIVVPVLENLSGIVKTLATGFGNLPGPIKSTAVAMMTMAGAAGPVALGVGKLTGRGGRGVLGSLLKVVKAHPKAFIAMGVAATATSLILGGMRKRAQEAKERMETLQGELIASGDPTVNLTNDFKALAESIGKVTEEAGGSVPDIKSFAGETTLTADLLKKGLVKEFEALGLNMEELMPLLSTGTDLFHEFGDETKSLATDRNVDKFVESLRSAEDEILPFTSALADAIVAGKLTAEQARQLHISLDDTADAFDDARNATKKSVKEFLEGEDALGFFTKAFGELGGSMLETTKEAEDQVRALQDMYTIMAQSQEMDLINSAFEDLDFGMGKVEETTKEVESRFRTFKATSRLTSEELAAVRSEFDKLVRQIDDVVDTAFGFDTALLRVKETANALVEAIAGLNDEEKTQLEREGDLLRASQRYADSLAGVSEELIGLPLEEVNGFFAEQSGVLDEAFRSGELAEEEYRRLAEVLGVLEQQVIDLNKREALVKIGVDTTNVPQQYINQLFGADGTMDLEGFGTSVGTFLGGGGSPTIPTGGGASNTTSYMNINVNVNDADPTAVTNALEKYVRENGSAPVATSTLTRK